MGKFLAATFLAAALPVLADDLTKLEIHVTNQAGHPIDNASVIVIEFNPVGPDCTEVVFTYTHLERHGEMAPVLRAAIGNPGPDSAVERYAEVVKRHAAAS